MARYDITEQPNGDFLIHFPDGDRRMAARRDRANAMLAIAVDGTRYTSSYGGAEMLQVHFVTYRREDGHEVYGPYIGQCLELEEL